MSSNKRSIQHSTTNKQLSARSKKFQHSLEMQFSIKFANIITNENLKLKKQINDLTRRIEFTDCKTRAFNILRNSLKCADTHADKTEFTKVCSDILNVSSIQQSAVKIGKNKYLFNMDSPAAIQTVLAAPYIDVVGRHLHFQLSLSG